MKKLFLSILLFLLINIYEVFAQIPYVPREEWLNDPTSRKQISLAITYAPLQEDLSQYLVPTAYCEIESPIIKDFAAQLTVGTMSPWKKAEIIFNWVRDNIDYDYYYNTLRGAVNTLKDRKGNCCDTSHLLVALFRAVGLPARYVHGNCYFLKSGQWYGHVWVQVYIDGEWFDADATSYRNNLGEIRNWDTQTVKIGEIYAELPF